MKNVNVNMVINVSVSKNLYISFEQKKSRIVDVNRFRNQFSLTSAL